MGRLIAITREERWDYVLESSRDDPEDEQTVFQLRSLTAAQQFECTRLVGKETTAEVAQASAGRVEMSLAGYLDACKAACRYALVGWRGVVDEDGADLPFPKNGAQAVAKIPTSALKEVGEHVMERANVTETDARNSL